MPAKHTEDTRIAEDAYLNRLQKLHSGLVLRRRERVLAQNIAGLRPHDAASLLDVGCGDGVISRAVSELSPGVAIHGVEVLEREDCAVPYTLFDGRALPYEDGAFDCVMFVDVLHHTDDPEALIGEAVRVARRYVLIKDHVWSHRVDHLVLRFMDWVGNRPYGVNLNYNYLQSKRWQEIFATHSLKVAAWKQDLGLYPFPFSVVFERGKHFLAVLEKQA